MNDRLLRALSRKPVDATPVWFMRQAGRYLPEYRELRAKHDLFAMMRTPELSAEATLLPVRRYDFDAAVMFSDISLPLMTAGLSVTIEPNQGPILANPVRTPEDVSRLQPVHLQRDLGFVFDTIRILRKELDVPLVGFAGAPFTLATYAIEGKGGRDMATTRAFAVKHPHAFADLLAYFSDVVARFLVEQHRAGAQAVQLFDSWAGVLNERTYREHVLPHTAPIFMTLKEEACPTIHFGTGNPALHRAMREAGGDCVSVDWRTGLDEAWSAIGHDRAIQGNLDPADLMGPAETAVSAAENVLRRAGGRPGHVFNLGHGIFPATPVDNVEAVIETVHRWKVGA
ncbi:MAG TPA: uroporphyrinogen decarboxylase [Candidatus Thermoplasmatota archaeon]|nr:uroporphyrinogen decarboxylase [Candidatus Thermoplasmatota archaeon]